MLAYVNIATVKNTPFYELFKLACLWGIFEDSNMVRCDLLQ